VARGRRVSSHSQAVRYWFSTMTRRGRAVASAAILGAATVLGVLVTDGVAVLAAHGLALSAGVTIYVGASNLVPEFQGKPGWRLPAAFFLGAGGFFAARALLASVAG